MKIDEENQNREKEDGKVNFKTDVFGTKNVKNKQEVVENKGRKLTGSNKWTREEFRKL